MEMINVREVVKDITVSQRIDNDQDKCGGYEAINIGSALAKVNGYPIAPFEGITRMSGLGRVILDSPIEIEISTGAKVRLTRMLYYGRTQR